MTEFTAADSERDDAVQRTSEAFEFRGRFLEHRRETAESYPGAAVADVGPQRLVEIANGACDVVTRHERSTGQRVGSSRRRHRVRPVRIVHGTNWSAHCSCMQTGSPSISPHGRALPRLVVAHHPSLDLLDADALARIAEVADIIDPEPIGDWNDERARALLDEAEVILGHWGCPPLDASVVTRAPHLGLFAYAAGTVKQTIDPEVFDFDIRITSGADANAEPVAEFTLATILFSNKDVFWQRDVRRTPRDPALREFRRTSDVPVGNYDKTIGIVGASLIGRRAHRVVVTVPWSPRGAVRPLRHSRRGSLPRCHQARTRRAVRVVRHLVDPRTGSCEYAPNDRG